MHAPNFQLMKTPFKKAFDPIEALLQPFYLTASQSEAVISGTAGQFVSEGRAYSIPRFIFTGPRSEDAPIRIGIFGGLHGDEPESSLGLLPFFRELIANPDLARGYVLFLYPLVNPTGFERATRESASGKDLNREFWSGSGEPEIYLLEQELIDHQFHGLIALHADRDSHGTYGYVQGATLSAEILDPALTAAEAVLPRNRDRVIDGMEAENGIIRKGYQGVLSSPKTVPLKTTPFEIVFETPQAAPLRDQIEATRLALFSILENYRGFISFSQNI